jgi:GDP/UDP-N,N'-diacetylbacillosamine 2-epimerase (hydrolysing)
MKRKVCVVTGSRAEYGLLKGVMEGVRASRVLELQLVVTGAHLSPEFGLTYREIERDGFRIERKIEMLLSSDTAQGVTKSMGLGLIGFGEVLQDLQPDLLLVLGDRYEILAAASAALVARVPIAHLHGGEKTEGAFDDAIRHAITKMSHLHFVAAEEYRRRVIQLGEHPERVLLVGGLGVDGIRRARLLDQETLAAAIDFRFGSRNLLVTYHPETLAEASSSEQMTALLAALETRPDIHIIFTLPNADTDGRVITRLIEAYVARHPDCKAYKSLGAQNFLSCLQFVDGVVGNSSSGLLEAPSFRKGTINIGDRQGGRLRAASVIDCAPVAAAISQALDRLYSPEFQSGLSGVRNPYGDGGASEKIVAELETVCLDGLLRKSFVDLPIQ